MWIVTDQCSELVIPLQRYSSNINIPLPQVTSTVAVCGTVSGTSWAKPDEIVAIWVCTRQLREYE